MRQCENCGYLLEEGETFCPDCGTKIVKEKEEEIKLDEWDDDEEVN